MSKGSVTAAGPARTRREHNTTHSAGARIRLRMALHAGEVTYDRHGVTAAAVNLAFRLLDAAVVKTALAESPGVLAVITSGWFYDEVVRHSPFSDAATYRPVHVTAKETAAVAWISLPDHPYPPAAPPAFPRPAPSPVPSPPSRSTRCRASSRSPSATSPASPGQPATPAVVLDSFLRALGCPPERIIPIGLEAQSALYRSLPARRRVLIVLDNANAAQQVRPLLPGSPGCLVLITSRSSLTGLLVNEAATRLTLDLLTSTEALDLVRGILGVDRVAAEPQAVTELIRICARLPLALRIAASRTQYSIADVVAEMNGDRARLDALSTLGNDPAAVRAVFDWSYQRLNTDQARLFRRLGLHPGPEISLHAAAAVADLDLAETRRLLDTLTDAHLLEPVTRDRYQLHDLLRAYAADRAEHGDSREDRDQARRTMLEWYANHTSAAYRALFPAATDDDPMLTLDTHATPPIAFAGTADAWAWLKAEQTNLIAAAHHAADQNLPELAIVLSYAGSIVPFQRGEWNHVRDLTELELAVARRSGNDHWKFYALLDLASAHQEVRQWRRPPLHARKHWNWPVFWASRGARQVRSTISVLVAWRRGSDTEAIYYLRSALPLSPGAQGGRLEGVIETNLGTAHIGLGRYEQALAHIERGLILRRQAGDRLGESYATGEIARARQGMGAHAEVISLCERALSIEPDLAHQPGTATILDTLGTSLQHAGDTTRAKPAGMRHWRSSTGSAIPGPPSCGRALMPWGSNGMGKLTHLNAVNTSGLAVGSRHGAGPSAA